MQYPHRAKKPHAQNKHHCTDKERNEHICRHWGNNLKQKYDKRYRNNRRNRFLQFSDNCFRIVSPLIHYWVHCTIFSTVYNPQSLNFVKDSRKYRQFCLILCIFGIIRQFVSNGLCNVGFVCYHGINAEHKHRPDILRFIHRPRVDSNAVFLHFGIMHGVFAMQGKNGCSASAFAAIAAFHGSISIVEYKSPVFDCGEIRLSSCIA